MEVSTLLLLHNVNQEVLTLSRCLYGVHSSPRLLLIPSDLKAGMVAQVDHRSRILLVPPHPPLPPTFSSSPFILLLFFVLTFFGLFALSPQQPSSSSSSSILSSASFTSSSFPSSSLKSSSSSSFNYSFRHTFSACIRPRWPTSNLGQMWKARGSHFGYRTQEVLPRTNCLYCKIQNLSVIIVENIDSCLHHQTQLVQGMSKKMEIQSTVSHSKVLQSTKSEFRIYSWI